MHLLRTCTRAQTNALTYGCKAAHSDSSRRTLFPGAWPGNAWLQTKEALKSAHRGLTQACRKEPATSWSVTHFSAGRTFVGSVHSKEHLFTRGERETDIASTLACQGTLLETDESFLVLREARPPSRPAAKREFRWRRGDDEARD